MSVEYEVDSRVVLEHVRDSSECPVNDYEFVALDMKLGTHVVMMDKKLLQDI